MQIFVHFNPVPICNTMLYSFEIDVQWIDKLQSTDALEWNQKIYRQRG